MERTFLFLSLYLVVLTIYLIELVYEDTQIEATDIRYTEFTPQHLNAHGTIRLLKSTGPEDYDTANEPLVVYIDSGSFASMRSDENRVFTAFAKPLYSNLPISFNWVQLGITGPLSVIIPTSQPHKLYIKERSLKPGNFYIFEVTVQQGNNTGTTTLQLAISLSSLYAIIDHTDGSIPQNEDLYLSAEQSHDPDDPLDNTGPLQYEWNCLEKSSPCVDIHNEQLIQDRYTPVLFVAKGRLTVGCKYTFYLRVNNTGKTAETQVELTTVNSKYEVSIRKINGKVNPQDELVIYARISGIAERIQWRQQNIENRSVLPYIKLEPGTLMPGKRYRFEVLATMEDQSTVWSSVGIVVSLPPSCPDGLIRNNAGEASLDNCRDPDSDYPLLYSFGFTQDNRKYFLTGSSYSNSLYISIPPEYGIIGKVCDSVGVCSSYTAIQGTKDNPLSRAEFNARINNKDRIPLSIFQYSVGKVITDSEFESLLTTLKEYVDSIVFIDSYTGEAIVSAYVSLLNHQNSPENVVSLLDHLSSFSSKLHEKLTQGAIEPLLVSLMELPSTYPKATKILSKAQTTIIKILSHSKMTLFPDEIQTAYSSKNLTIYKERIVGSNLQGRAISVSSTTAKLPGTLPIDSSDILDIVVSEYKYYSAASDAVDISVRITGKSCSHFIEFYDEHDLILKDLEEPIYLSFSCYLDDPSEYSCVYFNYPQNKWATQGCRLISHSENICTIEAYHTSLFSVARAQKDSCTSSYLPFYFLLSLLIVSLLFGATGDTLIPEKNEYIWQNHVVRIYSIDKQIDTEPCDDELYEDSKEIIIFHSRSNDKDLNDMVTPEFMFTETHYEEPDYPFYKSSSSFFDKFISHHLLFGQCKEYYYSKVFKSMLLFITCSMSMLIVGCFLLNSQTEDVYVIAAASIFLPAVLTLILETLINYQENPSLLYVLAVFTSLILSVFIIILSSSMCSPTPENWTKFSSLVLALDLLLFQSLLSVLKAVILA